MAVTVLHFRLTPRSVFGTPLVGDTLFGHLCWAIREGEGEARLTELLVESRAGRPFAVLSDAFPAGHLPRPHLPLRHLLEGTPRADERKKVKSRTWIPLEHITATTVRWGTEMAVSLAWQEHERRSHNTLDRSTGTTGEGPFAPFTQSVIAYLMPLDVHAVVDEERLPASLLLQLLHGIGAFGYGRNATVGEGRFDVELVRVESEFVRVSPVGTTYLCLANCAPQGLSWETDRSWYQPLVRFGRHGGRAALEGQPFKNPVLLARTGAALTPLSLPLFPCMGQTLGGNGSISRALPETVHQGWAPIVPLNLPEGVR